MSSKFAASVNRLFTATLLVALLVACQKTPESSSYGDILFKSQTNYQSN